MLQCTPQMREMQEQRLKIKQLGQQMQNLATKRAGLSAWEARELVRIIDEVYFQDPELKQILPGQMKYSCVNISEPPGKPIKDWVVSDNLQCGDLLLINPDMTFVPENAVILSICNGKLSICRCAEWRYGKCAFVPWCKDSDTLPAIHEEQADIILLGNVVGLHRTNLY